MTVTTHTVCRLWSEAATRLRALGLLHRECDEDCVVHRSLGSAPLNINETRALLRLLTVLCDGGDAALTQAARTAATKGKVG